MPPTVSPTTKIVPITIGEEYTPPEGWKLNSINDTVVKGNVQFFAVLVKPAVPPQRPPVNLKAEPGQAPKPKKK